MACQKYLSRFDVTPWRSREEFSSTRLAFVRLCPKVWKTAIENMMVWQIRMGPQLGEIYRVSFNILRHLLQIATDSRHFDAASAGVALSRFVQFFTERGDKERSDRYSIFELAKEADIPEWLVEIRHDAIHRLLPSLSLLNRCLEFARTYLWKYYWENLDDSVEDSDEVFRDKLSAYINQRVKSGTKHAFKEVLLSITPQRMIELVRQVASSLTLADVDKDEKDGTRYCLHSLNSLWSEKYSIILADLRSTSQKLLDTLVLQLVYYLGDCRARAGVVNTGLAAAWVALIVNEDMGEELDEHTLLTIQRICQENPSDDSELVLGSLPKLSEQREEQVKSQEQAESSGITLATDKVWSRIPIGHTFNDEPFARDTVLDVRQIENQSEDEDSSQSGDIDMEMDNADNSTNIDVNSSKIDFSQVQMQIF